MSKMVTDKNNKPPLPSYAFGCERGKDPWHCSEFPEHLVDKAPHHGKQKEGWFLLDWCGNQVEFVPDGTEFEEGENP